MTEPTIFAQDATEAATAVLAGLARAYEASSREVEQDLLELADVQRAVAEHPEQAGPVTVRDVIVDRLLARVRQSATPTHRA
ncbi:hypothetical protein [Streptomyces sp. NPDC047009]|uniref:hypothetical protein n=1 Tax=Streptomyces sp. NPDC047009 TaxID=3154496 RepID=UPI0033D9CE4F